MKCWGMNDLSRGGPPIYRGTPMGEALSEGLSLPDQRTLPPLEGGSRGRGNFTLTSKSPEGSRRLIDLALSRQGRGDNVSSRS